MAGCFCFLGAVILSSVATYRTMKHVRRRSTSDNLSLIDSDGGMDDAWLTYSDEYLNQLECEVRLLPPRAPHLGVPKIIDAKLIPVLFEGTKPGGDTAS